MKLKKSVTKPSPYYQTISNTPMDTPDTEKIAEGVAIRLDGRTVNSHEQFREMVKEEVLQALSSRDTYWKERVRKNVLKYSNQKFLEGNIVDPLELYEAITNEDNLK